MHIQLSIQSGFPEAFEILIAELSELNFEGFVEEEEQLQAFIPQNIFDKDEVETILSAYKEAYALQWHFHEVANENWNQIWESNFEPVQISNQLLIRALFHPKQADIEREIVIQPKMSFGTGHHATTYLVCEFLLDMDLQNKKVFDFGTGTGILAILARMQGADKIWAVDNDPMCIENAQENFVLNNCPSILLALGDLSAFAEENYDLIIGNITRNVILHYFEDISKKLKKNAQFLASGFYESDLELLKSASDSLGLQLESFKLKDAWCAASFRKL